MGLLRAPVRVESGCSPCGMFLMLSNPHWESCALFHPKYGPGLGKAWENSFEASVNMAMPVEPRPAGIPGRPRSLAAWSWTLAGTLGCSYF